ncbi:MAG: type I restriction-modification system subunit M [Succinivibrionaceae bacterium]|nr:type I restriction-modification system subunit M [Succinivibrionaceae bacterium]
MADNVQKQSQELANQLWAIANDLRGNMDASKFKNYILGVIFYRYLSEKTENYMNDLLKDDGVSYREALKDEKLAPTVMDWSIEHLGYVIEPRYLWASLIDEINGAEFSIDHFDKAISALVASTIGQESEVAFDKLFDDMNLQDKDLGKEVSDRTSLISKVMLKVNDISFNVDDAEMDVLGTAYMMLISLFASDAGKKGGEFFTPTCASKLLARLATVGLDEVKNAADSCAGSGSLLLEVQNHLTTKKVGHFYATEKNGSNYNLLRMNLLMHGVPYKQFSCFNSDSIKTDNYYENGEPILFDIQVENPPYSAKFDQNSTLLDDPRFSSCGVLTPQKKADLMFLQSMTYHMSDEGRIAVLLPIGALFRGKYKENGKSDAEYIIRKHLIENLNVIDAIIGLPPKMFHGAKLPVSVVVLKKKRNGNKDNILFIDASKYFSIEGTMNVITEEDTDRIMNAYINRKDIEKYAHVASLDEIRKNKYDCNIPLYVDSSEKELEVNVFGALSDIDKCEKELSEVSKKLNAYFKELGCTDIHNSDCLQNVLSGRIRFKSDDNVPYSDWEATELNEVLTERGEKSTGKEDVYSVSLTKGLVNQIEHLGRSYAASDTSKYKLTCPGDVIYTKSPTGDFKWGIVKQSAIDKNVIISPLYGVFIPKNPDIGFIIEAYFSSNIRAHNYLITQVRKGAKNTINVSNDEFLAKAIYLPTDEREQAKIADFIRLLDKEIELQSIELEAYKNIRKGTLQHVFYNC